MKSIEKERIMARYLVDRVGLKNASQGMIVSPKTLATFIETGEIKSTKILREITGYFFSYLLGELDKKSDVKNYDNEDLSDLKAGNRKGGAGGGSNNSFSTTVSDMYL